MVGQIGRRNRRHDRPHVRIGRRDRGGDQVRLRDRRARVAEDRRRLAARARRPDRRSRSGRRRPSCARWIHDSGCTARAGWAPRPPTSDVRARHAGPHAATHDATAARQQSKAQVSLAWRDVLRIAHYPIATCRNVTSGATGCVTVAGCLRRSAPPSVAANGVCLGRNRHTPHPCADNRQWVKLKLNYPEPKEKLMESSSAVRALAPKRTPRGQRRASAPTAISRAAAFVHLRARRTGRRPSERRWRCPPR